MSACGGKKASVLLGRRLLFTPIRALGYLAFAPENFFTFFFTCAAGRAWLHGLIDTLWDCCSRALSVGIRGGEGRVTYGICTYALASA